MAKLSYKTRGNSDPRGKELVFFTCHPQDFKYYFESICEDILKTQNCAIWYDEEPENAWDPEEMAAALGRMQLFVIPVTSRFLFQENDARKIYFRFAEEHRIPVLPLMQESGLEQDFNRICGDLQFLDKNAAVFDTTALPYEQKLERFLSSVLLGDELAQKVRKAFDAYIFLSYRKKDRKYAQELMRLIHQNDFCRDIAIWYDEFLVPGEDFNHAIQDAMEKSELFAFVVTPNLLEQDNYVMKIEYPAAKETGKPILPVEMVSTDHNALQANYNEIPKPADSHDAPALSDELCKGLRNLALEENANDPEHLFFIGLAYLSGIDVEENRKRGAELITKAAEENVPEAMEKLSQMYSTGEGVERDYETSAQWLEKLADYWEKQFEETGHEEDARHFRTVILKSGDAWYNMRRFEAASYAYRRLLNVSKFALEHTASTYWKQSLGTSYNKMGQICKSEGNLSWARTWFEMDLEICEELFKETGTVGSLQDLSVIYYLLGQLCVEEENLEEARTWYKNCLNISEELNRAAETVETSQNLFTCYDLLEQLCDREGNLEEAKTWSEKALTISEKISMETGTVEARQNLAASYSRQGQLCEEEENLSEARIWYEKALKILEELRCETGTVVSRQSLGTIFYLLVQLCKDEEKLSEAWTWTEKALTIFEELSQETRTVEVRRYLAIGYSLAGNICKAEEKLSEARSWSEKALEIFEELNQEAKYTDLRQDLIITCNDLEQICEEEGKPDEAKAWAEKAATIE